MRRSREGCFVTHSRGDSMSVTKVEFRSIPGTEAAVGASGSHTLVADRPVGVAGGQGLGFSGGQLLGLAIGGCMCNASAMLRTKWGST